MNILDLLKDFEPLLPVIAGMGGHPEVGSLIARLIELGEQDIERRMADSGKTRTEELADAAATYTQFKTENAALKQIGHE